MGIVICVWLRLSSFGKLVCQQMRGDCELCTVVAAYDWWAFENHQEAFRNQEDLGASGARQRRHADAQKRYPLLGKEFKTAGGCPQRGVEEQGQARSWDMLFRMLGTGLLLGHAL